jgi:tetratricopeptide (TPR) repeat protein
MPLKKAEKGTSNEKDKTPEKDAPRRTEKAQSQAMREASLAVKDFMTDNQKALTYLKVAKQLMERQEYRGAIELLSEAASLNPTASIFTTRATAYKALNLWQEAYFEYSYAIRLEPTNGSFFSFRALCATKLNKVGLALADMEQSITYEPTAHHIYTKGTIQADDGQLEKAILTFNQALRFEVIAEDIKMRCMYRKCLCLYELKQYPKTFELLKLVLAHDPNSVPPRVLISRAAKMTGDLKQAEEQMAHALTLDEKNPVNHMEMGDIRFRTGDKYKIVDAIYNFNECVTAFEEKRVALTDQLAGYAAQEKAYWDEINANKAMNSRSSTKETGMASSLRNAVADSANAQLNNGGDDPYLSSSKKSGLGEGDEEEDGEGEEGDDAEDEDDDNDAGGGQKEQKEDDDGVDGSGGGGVRASGGRRRNNALQRKGKTTNHHRPDGKALKELEKELADAYYRRSQCYVMLMNIDESGDDSLVHKALEDAKMATSYDPSDDDFQISVATCYIRLQRFEDAMVSFQTVLARSPRNEKALFQNAFCQRAVGRQKDAVGGLTKIIAVAQRVQEQNARGIVDPHFHMEIPLDTVYGTRGTLFHEMKAHKLALHDLGRAVALNEDRAENYFLRGDCHAKLGNYELALIDFNEAEKRKFHDIVSLTTSRGMIHRLLGDSYRARLDFETSLSILDELAAEERKNGGVDHPETQRQGTMASRRVDAALVQIRLSSLRALCFIDNRMYSAGYGVLMSTCTLVDEIEDALLLGFTISEAILTIDKRLEIEEAAERREKEIAAIAEKEAGKKMRALEAEKKKSEKRRKAQQKREAEAAGEGDGDVDDDDMEFASDDEDSVQREERESKERAAEEKDAQELAARAKKLQAEAENAKIVASLVQADRIATPPRGSGRAVDTVTLSHLRRMKWVLLYHMGLSLHQQKRFDEAQDVLEGCVAVEMLACAPDDIVVGIVHFFRGVELAHEDRLEEAEECFASSLASKWGAMDQNKTLINFAKAKLYQQQDLHEQAIAGFSLSIEIDPNNAWAFFRRAWSYKAVGKYLEAGADFEEAKKLRWDDPNFSIDYKRINKFAYMEIETEPDIRFEFPSLLPQPGLSEVTR